VIDNSIDQNNKIISNHSKNIKLSNNEENNKIIILEKKIQNIDNRISGLNFKLDDMNG